jgi:hypothetical protein
MMNDTLRTDVKLSWNRPRDSDYTRTDLASP